MFDPTIGRWLEEDPIGFDAQDPNLHRYLKNGPTGATDPSGRQKTVPQLLTATSQMQLSERPVVGANGAFFWPSKFQLGRKTEIGGWIIQDIRIKITFYNAAGDDITASIIKGLNPGDDKV